MRNRRLSNTAIFLLTMLVLWALQFVPTADDREEAARRDLAALAVAEWRAHLDDRTAELTAVHLLRIRDEVRRAPAEGRVDEWADPTCRCHADAVAELDELIATGRRLAGPTLTVLGIQQLGVADSPVELVAVVDLLPADDGDPTTPLPEARTEVGLSVTIDRTGPGGSWLIVDLDIDVTLAPAARLAALGNGVP